MPDRSCRDGNLALVEEAAGWGGGILAGESAQGVDASVCGHTLASSCISFRRHPTVFAERELTRWPNVFSMNHFMRGSRRNEQRR